MRDLVYRLRNPIGTSGSDFNASYWMGITKEASDAIEKLEYEQRCLRSENLELKELIQSLCDYTGTTASTTWIKFEPQPKWHLKENQND